MAFRLHADFLLSSWSTFCHTALLAIRRSPMKTLLMRSCFRASFRSYFVGTSPLEDVLCRAMSPRKVSIQGIQSSKAERQDRDVVAYSLRLEFPLVPYDAIFIEPSLSKCQRLVHDSLIFLFKWGLFDTHITQLRLDFARRRRTTCRTAHPFWLPY